MIGRQKKCIKTSQVVKFPEIDFPPHVMNVIKSLRTGDDRHLTKLFQWHKLNLFRPFFKQWDYVFYLDSNLHVTGDVNPILDQREKYKIVAQDDDFPRFKVLLQEQFDQYSKHFGLLSQKYDMTCRYFQTTILLFDTDLITESTFLELENLVLRYPCCGNNDQGFIALYFAAIKKVWKVLQNINPNDEKIVYYDIFRRNKEKNYIIYKG